MNTLPKTLLLSEKYPPLLGGSCTMFASRFALYPQGRALVLTGEAEGAREFDSSQNYPIFRTLLEWRGPKGFEWTGPVRQLFFAALPLVLKHKVEVIECARPIPEGVAGYLLAKLLRRKLVVNFHGEDIAVLQEYRVEKKVLGRLVRGADLNLVNSNFTGAIVKKAGGARIAVVAPGFIPPASEADAGAVAKLRERWGRGPLLLTVGRIQMRKGQDMVIRALPRLIKSFPDLRYFIVGSTQGGSDGLSESLVALANETGVADNVVLVGEVDAAELSEYYAACDAFIMANRQMGTGDVEGFGIVFLEAGHRGKPVIGGLSGGVPDAVRDGETGFLVDGNSPDAIAGAVEKLFRDPARAAEMGRAGRAFSESMTAARVFAGYAEALAALRA